MEEKTFKEKVQIIIENYNKFIGIKLELEERTDLKVHDVSYLCYDKEKLIKMLQEKFKERKEDVIKIVNEKNMDNVFSFYCDCGFNDFENDLDELGVNFRDVVRIGRTSSFYMIDKHLYELQYNHNDLVQVVGDMGLDIEKKIEKIGIKELRELLKYNTAKDLKDDIDIYLSDSESLLEEIAPWKKAKEYLDSFKENQKEDFVEFFYYNELNEEIWGLEKERERNYGEKVSKAIRSRIAHKRKRKNEKVIIRIS